MAIEACLNKQRFMKLINTSTLYKLREWLSPQSLSSDMEDDMTDPEMSSEDEDDLPLAQVKLTKVVKLSFWTVFKHT